MTWRLSWLVASVAVLGFSLFACGDADDIELHAPIWGYVIGPDGPVAATLEAGSRTTSAFARTDADGRYELPVPAGSYEIRVEVGDLDAFHYLSDGSFGWSDSETPRGRVEVEPLTNSLRMDIRLSSAQITVEGLDFWEGREILAKFGRADTTARVLGGMATMALPLIPPGNHALEIESAFVPGTHLTDGATRFSVAPGERAVIQTAMTLEPTLVRGSLVDPFGFAPRLVCLTPARWVYATPDSSGSFSVALWANSVMLATVDFDNPDFGLSSRMDGVADMFTLVPGETLDLPPFILPGVGVVPVGEATDQEEMTFWIREADTGSAHVWKDYSPPFAVGPLPLGKYLLGLEQGGGPCRAEWIPTQCDSSACDAVSIAIDASAPSPIISFPVRRGATIEGLIFDLPGAYRRHLEWEGETFCAGNTSFSSNYELFLSGLRPGFYRLQIECQGRVLWYPGVESEEEGEVIEIREDEERIWIEMAWPE